MKTNHTPGPWEHTGAGNICAGTAYGETHICLFSPGPGMHEHPETAKDNAELATLSPEMLAALLSLRKAFYVDGKRSALLAAFEKTHDIIKKLKQAKVIS